MATHSGLANVKSADTTITDDLVITDRLTINGTSTHGNAVTDSVGFYGVGPVSQRRSASQTVVTTLTGSKTTTNVAARLNVLIKYSMRVRADLVALGLIKGAA